MNEPDGAYEALTDHDDDPRWAYGTGFADPLAGVGTDLPSGVDAADLTAYCLMLGDDALILSHRLQQWITRAPELEEELAVANIALDLLGQARLLLTRAGQAQGAGRDEDALAYRRDGSEFRNVTLVERPDADFAHLVARLLLVATWRLALFDRLTGSRDPVLAAVAAKGVKELTYHRRYAADWVVRLGDGTDESHRRMQAAVDALAPYLPELVWTHPVESRLAAAGVAVRPAAVSDEVAAVLSQVWTAATLTGPSAPGPAVPDLTAPGPAEPDLAAVGPAEPDLTAPGPTGQAGGGRDGVHTAELAGVLAELQGLARATPGGVW